jgi:hypothetical protein
MQSELMQPGEEVVWRRELPVSPFDKRIWRLVDRVGLAFLVSVQLVDDDRMKHLFDGTPSDIVLLLTLPTAVLMTHMLPFARDRWSVRAVLIAALVFLLLLGGQFATPFTPGMALFGTIALVTGWLVTMPARNARTNGSELHLTNRGAHWVMPGLRPRFAPWDEVTTRFNRERLTLTGYPGEKKAFTLKLPLSAPDHIRLQRILGRTI